MSETPPTAPLDLSAIEGLDTDGVLAVIAQASRQLLSEIANPIMVLSVND